MLLLLFDFPVDQEGQRRVDQALDQGKGRVKDQQALQQAV